MLGSEHEAVPVVGDGLEELADKCAEVFDGIGVVFEDEECANIVGNGGFEDGAVREEATPGARAFVPAGGNADGGAVDGFDALGLFEGPIAKKSPEAFHSVGSAGEVDDDDAVECFGKSYRFRH